MLLFVFLCAGGKGRRRKVIKTTSPFKSYLMNEGSIQHQCICKMRAREGWGGVGGGCWSESDRAKGDLRISEEDKPTHCFLSGHQKLKGCGSMHTCAHSQHYSTASELLTPDKSSPAQSCHGNEEIPGCYPHSIRSDAV